MGKRLIDTVLAEIQQKCDYLLTKDQLDVIRDELLNYAVSAMMDSAVGQEINDIIDENNDEAKI